MIISDLEHVEIVSAENKIEGAGLVSGSSAAVSGATTGYYDTVSVYNNSYSSASQYSYYYGGTSTYTSASGYSSGYIYNY